MTLPAGATHAWLDLGAMQHYLEVWLNGTLVTTALWPPYEIDLTGTLLPGANALTLVVSNSVANQFVWDRWSASRSGAS